MEPTVAEKVCTKCGQRKPQEDFKPRNDRPWSRMSCCSKCHNHDSKKYRFRRDPNAPIPDEKECSLCGTVKPSNEFWRDNGRADGLNSSCKLCKSAKAPKAGEPTPQDTLPMANHHDRMLARRYESLRCQPRTEEVKAVERAFFARVEALGRIKVDDHIYVWNYTDEEVYRFPKARHGVAAFLP